MLLMHQRLVSDQILQAQPESSLVLNWRIVRFANLFHLLHSLAIPATLLYTLHLISYFSTTGRVIVLRDSIRPHEVW